MTRPTTWWLTLSIGFSAIEACSVPFISISAIQGNGPAAAITGAVDDPRRRRRRLRDSVGLGPDPWLLHSGSERRRRCSNLGRHLCLWGQRSRCESRRRRARQRHGRRISGPDADQRNLSLSLRHRNGGPGGRDAATAVCRRIGAVRGHARAAAADAVRHRALSARTLRPGRGVLWRAIDAAHTDLSAWSGRGRSAGRQQSQSPHHRRRHERAESRSDRVWTERPAVVGLEHTARW